MADNKRLINFIEGPLTTHYTRLANIIRKHRAGKEVNVPKELSDALVDLTTTIESAARVARGKKPMPHSPDLKGELLLLPIWGVGAIDPSVTEDTSSDEEEPDDEEGEEWFEGDEDDTEGWEEDDNDYSLE